jgi:hypothetical protein
LSSSKRAAAYVFFLKCFSYLVCLWVSKIWVLH